MTPLVWVVCIAAPPLAFVGLERLRIPLERLRLVAAVCAALCVVACAQVFLRPELGSLEVRWPLVHPLLGATVLRVSELTHPLLPLPAALWLVSVGVTPRSRLDGPGLARTALATLSTTSAFLTQSPIILVVVWAASIALFLRGLGAHEGARRVAGAYLWASAALMTAGVPLITLSHGVTMQIGIWLVIAAVLMRKGILPFHAWIPEVFDTGRIGPTVRFTAPQLGSYFALILVVPRASAGTLRALAIVSLISAVYGAALSLAQRDARRACGYLFVSQSALVLAGLDCTSPQALGGSLVIWLSSAFAFTGLTRALLALEVRRGRLDLTQHHGGYEQVPALAVSFLILGLACTGFPGTLGFIGQEMLIEGAVREFPMLGFFVVMASALTGLCVLRMYFSLFCGAKAPSFPQALLRREVVALGAVTALLVGSGLLPRNVVASRMHASRAILARGAQH